MPYEFTQDGYRDFSEKIIAAGGDQATVTSILADMQDTVNDNIGKLTKLTEDNKTITAENERLRNANMDLFLRIGSQSPEGGAGGQEGNQGDDKPITISEYMDKLFNKE